MADDRLTTRTTGTGPAATMAARPGPVAPATGSRRERRRRGVTEQQRPLWLLIPGGLLMTLIILIPLLLAIYISVIDLDQYTLRRWLDAEFINLQNYAEAFRSGLLHSMWI